MKLRPAVKGLFALVIALACFFAGRVGALWLLSDLFQKTDLTAETYAYAGSALRFIADSADSIAVFTGLFVSLAAGLFMKDRFPGEDGPVRADMAVYLLCSAAAGYFSLRLLVSADAVRVPLHRSFGAVDKWVLCFFLCAARSVILRGCCVKAARESGGNAASVIASMILDGVFFLFVYGGGRNVLACVNGLLCGAAFAFVYLATRSLWPEMLVSFGFTAAHRFLGGYPAGGLYSVGEGALTGFGCGIECSLTLTILLLIPAIALLYLYGKKNHGRKKTPVHR